MMKSITLARVLSVIAALPLLTRASESYTLLHRVSSHTSTPGWTERGLLDISNGTVLTNTLTQAQVEGLQRQASGDEAKDLWYQVALKQEGKEELWTSVRLCHLRQSHEELKQVDDELTVMVRGQEVIGLGYRVRDIALGKDGCPERNTAKLDKINEEKRKQRQRQLSRRRSGKITPAPPAIEQESSFSTLVHLHHAKSAAKLQLQQAAPTNEDGTIQQPPPEKSFLQKYWMYMIPVVILLIMPDGSDDGSDKGAEAHASSDHRGQGMGAKRLN